MRISYLFALSLFIFLPTPCSAEDLLKLSRNQKLSLSEVVSQAVARNPKQQLLKAGSAIVDARNQQASGLLPSAPAVTLGHQNDVVGSNRNLYEWEVGLELPIWMPGQRLARESIALSAKNDLESSRNSLALEIAGQVRDTLWSISMADGDIKLAESQYLTAQSLQNDVEKRWKAGELAKTDVMMAENITLGVKNTLIRVQAELKHAEHRYWMLTGLKELPQTFEETLHTREGIDDSHPWLIEANSKTEVANGQRDLMRIEKRENPQVFINARRERGGFDTLYNDSVGVSVRVPLDAKTRSAPMLAGAEMDVAQAMSEREQRRLLLESSFHEAEHNLETINAQITLVEQQYKLSQDGLQLAKKSFSLGESDLVSLLRSQSIAYEAERSLINLHIQKQWNIARYNQSIGVLP